MVALEQNPAYELVVLFPPVQAGGFFIQFSSDDP